MKPGEYLLTSSVQWYVMSHDIVTNVNSASNHRMISWYSNVMEGNPPCLCLFSLQGASLGYELMAHVFAHLDILETDYFGLQYTDEKSVTRWIDQDKSIKKQTFKQKGRSLKIVMHLKWNFTHLVCCGGQSWKLFCSSGEKFESGSPKQLSYKQKTHL